MDAIIPPVPLPSSWYRLPPMVWDGDVLRFRANPLVRYLLDCGRLHLTELHLVAGGCDPNPHECKRQHARPEMIQQAEKARALVTSATVDDWQQLYALAATNPIVRYLIDHGGIAIRDLFVAAGRVDLDHIEPWFGSPKGITETTEDDWDLFHMLIGYSVSGLPYKSEETYRRCVEAEFEHALPAIQQRMRAAIATADKPGGS